MEKCQIGTIFLYEYKLGKKATKTARKMKQAFGHRTVNEHVVQLWHE